MQTLFHRASTCNRAVIRLSRMLTVILALSLPSLAQIQNGQFTGVVMDPSSLPISRRRMAAVTSSQDQIIRHGYDLSAWHHLNSPPFPTNLMASVSSSPAAPRESAKQ